MTYTAEDKLKCAERELRQRARVYPRLVEQGKMTAEKSDREMALMAEIANDYRAAVTEERLI